MLCRYCNAYRLANKAPCPHCGAPSPLVRDAMDDQGMIPPLTKWRAATGAVDMRMQSPLPLQQPSLLPVPYQAGVGVEDLRSPDPTIRGMSLIPAPPTDVTSLLPVLPEAIETVHVPPMYTKPRAIIPRYRVMSGLASLLIVFVMLCGGAVYYAQVSGKLGLLYQLWGDARPPNVAPNSALPNPPLMPEFGPAKAIINSASTASKVDPNADVALQPSNVFVRGQTIYLVYSVHPKNKGVVVLKWYTNNVLYKSDTSPSIADAKNGVFTMQYTAPVEGKVELYWNDQLAVRLFFVVR